MNAAHGVCKKWVLKQEGWAVPFTSRMRTRTLHTEATSSV